jgi:hypothetical protein
MRLLACLALLATALPILAAPQWYGGDLHNNTTPGRTEIKISAEGDLRGGGTGVREVKPGETADKVGVIDCDMAIGVWRYGPGERDFKFYTRRVYNLQTLRVSDKPPGTEPSGWDRCVDGHDMTEQEFEAAKKKYWDFEKGGIYEWPAVPGRPEGLPSSVVTPSFVDATL